MFACLLAYSYTCMRNVVQFFFALHPQTSLLPFFSLSLFFSHLHSLASHFLYSNVSSFFPQHFIFFLSTSVSSLSLLTSFSLISPSKTNFPGIIQTSFHPDTFLAVIPNSLSKKNLNYSANDPIVNKLIVHKFCKINSYHWKTILTVLVDSWGFKVSELILLIDTDNDL